MILLRHGKPAEEGICYGQSDPALAEPPTSLAASLRAAIGSARPIYSSPAPRCLDLAHALADSQPVNPVTELQELNFGDWEGLNWDRVERRLLDQWARAPLDFTPPNGESGRELFNRVERWWYETQPPNTSLIVAHAGSIRALLALIEGKPFDQTWQRPVPFAQPIQLDSRPG